MKTTSSRNASRKARSRRGTSFIEMLAGGIFIIPIALSAVDLSAIVMSNSINDHLAKDAARAAANHEQVSTAKEAANKTIMGLGKSAIIPSVEMTGFEYKNEVTVQTRMVVKFPAPLPGWEGTTLVAKAVEPIVAAPADI
jgi:Flp pilus assembly protein TadG